MGKVVPMADAAGKLFYDNLLAADPNLRPLFKGNMEEQARKLTTMINAAVSKLDELDTLVPILQKLGERHGGYGVRPEHYQTVGAALLKTLEQGLVDSFNPQVKEAWGVVYGTMSTVMIEAAKAHQATYGFKPFRRRLRPDRTQSPRRLALRAGTRGYLNTIGSIGPGLNCPGEANLRPLEVAFSHASTAH